MTDLFLFDTAITRDREIDRWLKKDDSELRATARRWFEYMRDCGNDVDELMHDGYPTACVGGAAFAYVGVFKNHANVGFFFGAGLPDPKRLLEGSGKRMRHVKLRPGKDIDASALEALITEAYRDIRGRIEAETAEKGGTGPAS